MIVLAAGRKDMASMLAVGVWKWEARLEKSQSVDSGQRTLIGHCYEDQRLVKLNGPKRISMNGNRLSSAWG